MSTMRLRAPAPPNKLEWLNRVANSVSFWVEIFSEAQRMAREAERRFTFGHR